jgi:alkylation response protein AidB-like acyl-CoA dehydrogenase
MNVIAPISTEQDEQDRQILDSVDRFLDRHVRPVAVQLEHDDIYPQEIVDRMKEMGLFGAVIPVA